MFLINPGVRGALGLEERTALEIVETVSKRRRSTFSMHKQKNKESERNARACCGGASLGCALEY